MTSWSGIPELRASYRKLGALRFFAMMLALLVWIGIFAWLSVTLDFPRSAGSTCHGKCTIEDFWYSPYLLRHGGWMGFALFAWLWSMPAFVVGMLIYAKLKKRRDRTFL